MNTHGAGSHVPIWRFRCEADRLPNGRYRVAIVSDSGKRVVREGYHPIQELIRAVYHQRSNVAVMGRALDECWEAHGAGSRESQAPVGGHQPPRRGGSESPPPPCAKEG